jgi:hypothetical protein
VGYRAWVLYGPGGRLDRDAQHLLQVLVPGVVEAGLVLLAGRTFGEWVVSVRAVASRPALAPLARIAKLAVGIGPLLVLVAITDPWTTWALLGWGVVTVAAVVPTQQHRGLAHALSGMRLEISSQVGREVSGERG